MTDVRLRPIHVEDLELLLAWRSNPDIYKHFRDQDGPLTWEEHLDWFGSRESDRRDFMIETGGRRVGVVSVLSDGEISIYIGETELWGQGIAGSALEEVVELMEDITLKAWIRQDNEASKRLFEGRGFEHQAEDNEWNYYEYEA